MGHGIGLRGIGLVRGQQQTPAAPDDSGPCHLLGPPQPWQRSRWGDDLAAARRVLGRLAQSLPECADWPCPLKPGAALDDNPFIPAGYTYLLQLVAHDLMPLAAPPAQKAAVGSNIDNPRRQGMLLHALYGGGPFAWPSADQPGAAISAGPDAAGPGGKPGAAADAPRDHDTMLSQLVALFSLAHNIIADGVQPVRPEARFAYARAVMLAVYHSIVRCDLLPRLLHPAIWRAMNERGVDSEHWLWRQSTLPLEFSHGAFVAGHRMVRHGYVSNDRLPSQDVAPLVAHSASHAGGPRPTVEADGIGRWSRFFTLGRSPHYSRRIAPTRSSLDVRAWFPAEEHGLLDPPRPGDRIGPASAPMWSVDAMLRAVMQRVPDVVPPGWMFADASRRRSIVTQWLIRTRRMGGCLTDHDMAVLGEDPPLPLFMALEAGLDPVLRGRCLGILGSIIVGEVMFRRLAEEYSRLEMLRTAAQTALPVELADAVGEIDSMPALVTFVARFGGSGEPRALPSI